VIQPHTYIWFDIGYTTIITPGDYSVEIEVYKHVGRVQNYPLYMSEIDINLHVPYLEEAKMFAEGGISWEGCSDWEWNQEDCQVHLCNKEEIANMGIMMARVLDVASSHIKVIK